MASDSKIRVRFAPSPTGQLHVGNARTALFNWLFARQKGGTMVLRIEDTDIERSEVRYEAQLIQDLKWLGLDWDEGPDAGGPYTPYRQSERLDVYRSYAERLLEEGKAYLCFCSAEELEREREQALAEHRQPIYSGKCRALDPAEAKRRRAAGEPAAIRLNIPDHPIRFHDMVRGSVEFPNEVVSDPIVLRSSGMPVYNYVVVIDDALMKISHVIRGDDHVSNTPRQVALYEALGWPVPEFAHLSTILGGDRERLSKRHGAVSLANFREMGILPEALMNYLALLGWAPSGGTREIFSKDELIKEFSLERVTPSPAVFDMEKLYWLNRHYIRQQLGLSGDRSVDTSQISDKVVAGALRLGPGELLRLSELGPRKAGVAADLQLMAWTLGYFRRSGLAPDELPDKALNWFFKLIAFLLPNVDKLQDVAERARPIFFDYDPKSALGRPDNAEVLSWPSTPAVFEAFARRVAADDLARFDQLTAERFKDVVNAVKKDTGTRGKELYHPIRLMLTGSHSGPEFDKVIPLIEESSRLELPKHVLSVRERVDAFQSARKAAATD